MKIPDWSRFSANVQVNPSNQGCCAHCGTCSVRDTLIPLLLTCDTCELPLPLKAKPE